MRTLVECETVGEEFSVFYDGVAWLVDHNPHCGVTVLQGSLDEDGEAEPVAVEGFTVYTAAAARFLAQQLTRWADAVDPKSAP